MEPPPPPLTCAKCASLRVIPCAQATYRHRHGSVGEVDMRVQSDPKALIMTGEVFGELEAKICVDCGYTEFYTGSLSELWMAYMKRIGERTETSLSRLTREWVRGDTETTYGVVTFRIGEGTVTPKARAGLDHCFHVMAWTELNGVPVIPWAMLRAAIPAVTECVGAETVTAEWVKREEHGFFSTTVTEKLERAAPWDDLMQMDDLQLTVTMADIPNRVRFTTGTKARLEIVARVGARLSCEFPLNNGLCFSCFSATPLDAELEAIFTQAAADQGYKVYHSLLGATTPPPPEHDH